MLSFLKKIVTITLSFAMGFYCAANLLDKPLVERTQKTFFKQIVEFINATE